MENHLELKKDQRTLGISVNTVPSPSNQRVKLQDRFHPEKPMLSYADLHREITKDDVKAKSPKLVASQQKRRIGRETTKEDELVKYMSNLPSYLERGVNPQEKFLNVGVLDWGRLEKWQFSHKQKPNRTSRYSFSSSYTSSSFSTDGSLPSSSPSHQRTRRPSLQFHLMASPEEGNSQPVKPFGQGVTKFQEVKTSHNDTLSVSEHRMFIRADHPLSRNHPETKLGQCEIKDSDQKIDAESRILLNGVDCEVKSSMAARSGTQEGECTRGVEKSQGQKPFVVVDQDLSGKSDTVVLLLPKDFPQQNHSVPSQLSDTETRLSRRPVGSSQRNFSEVPNVAHHADNTDSKLARLRSCEIDYTARSQMKWSDYVDAEGRSHHSERSCSVPRSAKVGISPPRVRNLEDKNSTVTFIKSAAHEPPKGPDLKVSKVAAEKVRSTSPFRRLGIGMGKIIKSSSSKEGVEALQSNSTRVCAKAGRESAAACSCCETSIGDKGNATSKARSSPLRRLLDPLLKPKVDNCHHSGEPVQRDSTPTDRASKPPNGRLDSLSGIINSGKLKLDMASCRTINVDDSAQEKKHGSSAVQALLQVAMKNGLPLFTFAVDNNSDVLAATMKKLSTSRKDDHCCVYTFFTIQEVKKKNGRWMNQGGKSKGHDIIPNVVAQMKASCFHFSNVTRERRVDHSGVREFVLFSVDLRQADEQTSNMQANDELAAIVVKMTRKVNQTRSGHNLPEAKDGLPLTGLTSGENGQGQSFDGSHDLLNATVILPSGAHSLPSKGGPSSLIERWRTGGSCDCGGWDLGCNLRILANQYQIHRKSNSSKAFSTGDQFELFSQGGGIDEKQTAFCLSPFKEGIYSVEFNPSLSLLQAFSICIAVLDSRKPCEFLDSSNLSEEKTSVETILAQKDGSRAPDQIEGEVPARYVSYPPHSPVGRV